MWVCVLGPAVPEAAFGQGTITADNRKIEALVDCTDAGGTWSWGPTTMTPSAPGATFNETLEYNGISPNAEVDADGIAIQSSSLNGSTTFSSLITSGSAYAFADVSGLSPNYAQVDVESYFWIQFTIDTTQDYTLTGALNRDSVSGLSVRIRLRPVGGSDIHYSTAAGPFDWQGTLEPGTYELQARATALYAGSGYYDREASFDDVEFALIPEPGALGLLVAGLPLLIRRRAR